MMIGVAGEYGGREFIRDSQIANAHGFMIVNPLGHSVFVKSEEQAEGIVRHWRALGQDWKYYLAISPDTLPQISTPILVPALPLGQRPAA